MPASILIFFMSIITAYFVRDLFDDTAYLNNDSFALFFVLQETYSALAYLLYALCAFFWHMLL